MSEQQIILSQADGKVFLLYLYRAFEDIPEESEQRQPLGEAIQHLVEQIPPT